MENLNKKNNEEQKKRKKRKIENKVKIKFLRPGEILLTSTSNNKTTTFLVYTNESTEDILNYFIGHGKAFIA